MKIRVSLLIDVDPAKWAASNGQLVDGKGHFTTQAVRDDIRSYVLHQVQMAALIDETDAEVSL